MDKAKDGSHHTGSPSPGTSKTNPFKMPKNAAEFKKQEEEKERLERRRQLTLKVYEKGVEPRDSTLKFISRIFKVIEDEEAKEEAAGIRLDGVHATTENEKPFEWGYYHIGTISDFVEKEREICRLEYAIAIGKRQIENLSEQIRMQVEEMVRAENCYNDEAFEKYVEEEERKTLLALTRAEEHKKALKVIDVMIQKTKNELGKMRREIAKSEQNMKLNQQHEDFLLKLSPPEFQKEQENRRQIAEQIKAAERKRKRDRMKRNRHRLSITSQNSHSRTPPQKHSKPRSNKERMSPQDEMAMMGNLVAYERPQIYFNNPQQLMNIMTKTEKDINNMAQEMSLLNDSLEDYKEMESNLMKCIKTENSQMVQEAELHAEEIKKHKARIAELQNDIKDFTKRERNKEQEEALQEIDQKVREVYSSCIGFPDDNQATADVLRGVDAYLYDLMEKFIQLPEKEFITIKKQYRKDVIARAKMKAEQERQRALEERRQRRAEKKRQQALAVTISPGKKAAKPSGRNSPKK